MKIIIKPVFIKSIMFGLGWLFMFLQSSCCGDTDDDGAPKIIGDPNMIVYIYTSPNNVFYNDSFSFILIKPDFNYTKIVGMDKNAFPLLIDANEMDFLVTKKGGGIDTLIVKYDIELNYYAGTRCEEPYYFPKAKINYCFTRNLLFNVVSYGLKR